MDNEEIGEQIVRALPIYVSNVFMKILNLCASAHTRRGLASILTDKSNTEIKSGLSAAHLRTPPLRLAIVLARLRRRQRDNDFQFDSWKFENADELEK